MEKMFHGSKFTNDISSWNVVNVTNMNDMFSHSRFNCDISGWNVDNVKQYNNIFCNDWYNSRSNTRIQYHRCPISTTNKPIKFQ